MINESLTFPLFINGKKLNETHPDLTGDVNLDGKSYEVALWTRHTMDGTRMYHAGNLYDADQRKAAFKAKTKCAPLAKFKLYEARKRLVTDPDFHSEDPIPLGGILWYASLFVTVPADSDALEALNFRFVLSREATRQAPSEAIINTLSDLRARLMEREAERLAEEAGLAQQQGNNPPHAKGEVDDIDMSPGQPRKGPPHPRKAADFGEIPF
jgi:hypothetical protein